MPTDGDGLSLFGSRFEARVDFNKAMRDADTLDRQLDRIARNVNYLGTVGKGQIDAFAASLARAASAAGGLLNAQGGMLLGTGQGMAMSALGGSASFAPYTQLGSVNPIAGYLPSAFVAQQPAYANAPRSFYGVPPSISSSGTVDLIGQYNTRLPPRLGGATFGPGAIPGSGIIDVPYRVIGSGSTGGGGGSIIPYAAPPPWAGQSANFYAPHSPGIPRGFNMGNLGGSGFYAPMGAAGMLRTGFTQPVAGGLGQSARMIGNALSYQNIMRAAGGMYLAQNIGNMVTYAGRQTIGQAMYLEERQALLENALMSNELGMGREMAATLAGNLTSASYFAGMPVTAQEMGLSRPELAEQFRSLAPVIRLTAKTQDEFRTGLQTGALARALLVARDPVQGTRGAAVALSELYSGGPDRFRSLALRFELPRNRLNEIEQEMGGAGSADPGQVVIQMLNEMGFGPDYLVRRAGTLAGQLGRAGALGDNFRVDLYERSMNKVRDNLTGLNDAFESFLDSDAGDRVIGALDNVFGRITGFLTDQPINLMTSMFRGEGAISTDRVARNIADYMQVRDGGFVNESGRITDAATAFREAAEMITGKGLTQALRAPQVNEMSALGLQGGLYTLGGIALTGVADRVLAGGMMQKASRNLFTAGGRAAFGAAAGTAALSAAGALLPMAAIAGVGFTAAMGVQSSNLAQDWQRFAAENPELAMGAGVREGIGGFGVFRDRLSTWTNRFTGAVGSAASWVASGGRVPFEAPGLTSQAQLINEGLRQGDIALRLRQQAALLSVGNPDSALVRSSIVASLGDWAAQNPDDPRAQDKAAFGAMVEDAMRFAYSPGGGGMAGEVLTTTALNMAALRNAALTSGGHTYAADPAGLLASGGAAGLWNQLLADSGGDNDKAILLLTQMMEALTGIEVNTDAIADSAAFSYIRPSGAGDIFTGYNADADMRFARRSGVATPGSGARPSTGGGGTGMNVRSGSSAASGTQRVALAARSDFLNRNTYLDGIITSGFGESRGGHTHGGIDYVMPLGSSVTAPYAGTVEYLFSQEDFAPYLDMLPGGYKTYGNTVLFRDSLGLSTTPFSHLSDQTQAVYGGLTTVRPGQAIGFQGNTGTVHSDHGGDGTHVHQELWMSDGKGGQVRVDPLYSEGWFNTGLPNVERTLNSGASVNVNMGDFNINITPDEMSPEEITDEILENPSFKQRFIDAIASALERGSNADRIVSGAERHRARVGA